MNSISRRDLLKFGGMAAAITATGWVAPEIASAGVPDVPYSCFTCYTGDPKIVVSGTGQFGPFDSVKDMKAYFRAQCIAGNPPGTPHGWHAFLIFQDEQGGFKSCLNGCSYDGKMIKPARPGGHIDCPPQSALPAGVTCIKGLWHT